LFPTNCYDILISGDRVNKGERAIETSNSGNLHRKAAGRPKGGKLLSVRGRAITPEQYREAVSACTSLTASQKVNDKWALYLRVLWETGVRASEALAIVPEDIQGDTLTIRRLKRKKKLLDEIPIQESLQGALARHINGNRIRAASRRLFPESYGNVSYIWRSIREAAGLPKYLTLHSFRHGFAINFIKQSPGDATPTEVLAWLQDALGHSSISSTSVYTQTEKEETRKHIARMKF